MTFVEKPCEGSKSSITSIASGNDSQYVDYEKTTQDGFQAPLKVRKPYTISKQREKWSEEDHTKFIQAIKLYGRAWRQIEEYIGTKTAVQIRSHAQKFFSKVAKEGSGSTEVLSGPIEIPPPRPKRKPLHPYPRRFVETSNKARTCLSFHESGTSTGLKNVEMESHSPTSVLAPEGSQISISHAKNVGSGSGSADSPDSSLSHAVENCFVSQKENEMDENLSLELKLSGPALDDPADTKALKELKGIESSKNKDEYSESGIKFAALKTIKLFGHDVVVSNPLGYSDGQPVSSDVVMGGRKRAWEKEGSNGTSSAGSNSHLVIKMENQEINQDFGDSMTDFDLGLKKYKKGFVPYKRCASDREFASLTNYMDDRRSQQVYL